MYINDFDLEWLVEARIQSYMEDRQRTRSAGLAMAAAGAAGTAARGRLVRAVMSPARLFSHRETAAEAVFETAEAKAEAEPVAE